MNRVPYKNKWATIRVDGAKYSIRIDRQNGMFSAHHTSPAGTKLLSGCDGNLDEKSAVNSLIAAIRKSEKSRLEKLDKLEIHPPWAKNCDTPVSLEELRSEFDLYDREGDKKRTTVTFSLRIARQSLGECQADFDKRAQQIYDCIRSFTKKRQKKLSVCNARLCKDPSRSVASISGTVRGKENKVSLYLEGLVKWAHLSHKPEPPPPARKESIYESAVRRSTFDFRPWGSDSTNPSSSSWKDTARKWAYDKVQKTWNYISEGDKPLKEVVED